MLTDGALARQLDFGVGPASTTSTGGFGRAGLRLARPAGRLTGSDKYQVLERRRRQAQIAARRLLDRLDGESGAGGDVRA